MRFILSLLLIGVSSFAALGSADSLIITGQISNLNGRLYRQAPVITFSRNNIFQPQTELSRQAPLQPDGSFRVALPILYTYEEIYLDYSGKASAVFLGSRGQIHITFNGDSLGTNGKLFYFDGANAQANNLYYQYVNNENKLFKSNVTLGTRFYDNFWNRDPTNAVTAAGSRAELRLSALTATQAKNVPNAQLDLWVKGQIEDERRQNIYEYLLNNELTPGKQYDSLSRVAQPPLTVQRVTLANRFGNYADRKVQDVYAANPAKSKSLPAKLTAELIAKHVANLSPEERTKVLLIGENGISARTDLDFLSRMYSKNERVLNVLFDFERSVRVYSEIFEPLDANFLKARYFVSNFYKYTPAQTLELGAHIQSGMASPQLRASLDELVNMQMKDSADIRKMVAFRGVTSSPVEVLPGYRLSASNGNGVSWLNNVLKGYTGKTVYLIKWSLNDVRTRELLDYIPSLQAQLPRNVEFVFVHFEMSDDLQVDQDLVKQYIVRHRLKGVHLCLNEGQAMELLFKLNPMDPGTFAIIRPNGKFLSKTAPNPSETEKVIQAILQAAK
jgi:hypothetical protein